MPWKNQTIKYTAISASLTYPFTIFTVLKESVRAASSPSAPFGFYIPFQVQKPFVAILQETAELIFKGSRRFPSLLVKSTGERMGEFTIGAVSFCSFFPVLKGAMIFMAVEIIPFMEVSTFPVFLMVMRPMEPVLPLFFPCRCRLGLFDR